MGWLEQLKLSGGARLPVLYQTEAAECGLACLAMVASYHGHQVDLPALRTRFSISLKGATLAQLVDIASRMELVGRPLRIELAALAQLRMPAILHWNLNHFVVLKRVKSKSLLIHDPAQGLREVSFEEASRCFTGVALELEPNLQFQRKSELSPIQLGAVLGRVVGLRQSLFQVVLLALVIEVFVLVGPMLNQWVIDDALVSSDADLLTLIVIGITGLSLLQAVVSLVRARTLMYLGTSLNVQWVANVVTHLFRLPVDYFEKRSVGDIQTRFGAIGNIQQTLTSSFAAAILDGLMALTTLAMMLAYAPGLALISLAAVALYGILRELRFGALRTASLGQLVRRATQQSQFLESLRGIQAIKLFNRNSSRLNRYMKVTVDTANCEVAVQRIGQHFDAANSTLVALETGLILWLGGHLVLAGGFTVGMLMAFVAFKSQFTSRVISLIDRSVDLRMLRLQAERLADIVLTAPETEPSQPFLSTEQLQPSLTLRNVSFRYADGEPLILNDFSMRVEAGESVVLVGPSGTGKTTLLKILLGQLTPASGTVEVGDVPLSKLGLNRYRDMIGVVMQNDQLLAGTLAENISFFDEEVDQNWVEQCAKLAFIHADIIGMPMGYNSLVGDMGTTLSGGQKQRVMLARALYKRPRILLLDEATSHLDSTLELSIGAAIAQLNITRVVIAHRQETIRASGRIITLGQQVAAEPPPNSHGMSSWEQQPETGHQLKE